MCFSSDHDSSFSQLPVAQVETVIDAWADRTAVLQSIDSIDYVFCFENRGEEIGVTLSHPHGQIYGYPFVPPRFYRTAEAFERHRERTGRCLQCDLLEAELDDGRTHRRRVRVVGRVRPVRRPLALRGTTRAASARARPARTGRRRAQGPRPDLPRPCCVPSTGSSTHPTPYIAGWQQAPARHTREPWHLGAEIFTIRRAEGKLKYLAGSESGAAVWINDIAPEDAAARLRAGLS